MKTASNADQPRLSPARRLVLGVAVAAVVVTAGLAASEGAIRSIDGYTLATVRLVRPAPRGGAVDDLVASYVGRIPTAPDVDRRWFALDPTPVTRPADEKLEKRFWSHPGRELASVYDWNREFVRSSVCEYPLLYEAMIKPLDDVYTYTPHDGGRWPPFRFPQGTRLPTGLVTNAFGWRGPDVPLSKPHGAVRIAFVGASTTVGPHGDPFSYPDYIRHWLAVWGEQRHPGVRFEVVNAGREGVNSTIIGAIVREEVVPIDPDLVVYYEGSNQFWPADFIDWPGGAPPKRETAVPPALQPWAIERYSALAVRLHGLRDRLSSRWREPVKPPLTVKWPVSLDEADPQLDAPQLPVNLSTILSDLDGIRSALRPTGARFALSSFVWCVFDGMRFDPGAKPGLYGYLNTTFWPFSYGHMRRLADFQNHVFAKYAAAHDAAFLDVARDYPLDPQLFGDAIHMGPAGVKLMAWVSFQQLLPYVAGRIAAGEWPRPASLHLAAHPGFDAGGREIVRIADVKASCPAH